MSKIGRNEPCPCGSGKKYKKCCGNPSSNKFKEFSPSINDINDNSNYLNQKPDPILSYKNKKPNYKSNSDYLSLNTLIKINEEELKNNFTMIKNRFAEAKINLQKTIHECDLFLHKKNNGSVYLSLFNKNVKERMSLCVAKDKTIYISDYSLQNISAILFLYYFVNNKWKTLFKIPYYQKEWDLLRKILLSYFKIYTNDEDLIKLDAIVLNEREDNSPLSDSFKKNKNLIKVKYKRSAIPLDFFANYTELSNETEDFLFDEKKTYPYYSNHIDRNNIINSVFYLFNDHTLIPLDEITANPYSIIIPNELLPDVKDKNKNFENLSWFMQPHFMDLYNFSNHKIQKIESILLSFLEKIFNNKKKNDLKILLAISEKKDKQFLNCFNIEKIKFLYQPEEYHWEINIKNTIEGQIYINGGFQDRKINAQYNPKIPVVINQEKNEIIFHNFNKQVLDLNKEYITNDNLNTYNIKNTYRIHSSLNAYHDEYIKNSDITSNEIPDKIYQKVINNHQIINTILHNFANNLQNKFKISLQIPKAIKVPNEQIKINHLFNSKEDEIFSIMFSIPIENIIFNIQNLPPEGNCFFSALTNGFGFFFENENTSLATNQEDKRKNDLRFLRHQGISLFLIYEITNFILNNKDNVPTNNNNTNNKKNIKQFKDKLFNKLAIIFENIINKKTKVDFDNHNKNQKNNQNQNSNQYNLKNYISSKVISLIDQWINKFFQPNNLSNYNLFINNKIYQIDLQEITLTILQRIINIYLAKKADNNCFLKQRITHWNNLKWNFFSYKVKYFSEKYNSSYDKSYDVSFNLKEANIYPNPNGYYQLINNAPKNQSYFIDGKKIELINEKDFTTEFSLNSKQDSEIDWFELDPKFFFKGNEITKEQAYKFVKEPLIEYQGKFYLINKSNLPQIKWLEYFWQKIQNPQQPNKYSSNTNQIYKLEKSQVLSMLALRKAGMPVIGDKKWKDICEAFDKLDGKFSSNNNICQTLPKQIRSNIKKYQQAGIQWLYDLYQIKLGGILADDMGLGKTLQVLSFLSILHNEKKLKKTLIVVPTSLIYNWQSENEKFNLNLPIDIFSANTKEQIQLSLNNNEANIIICTYGLLFEHNDFFTQWNWNIIAFDEAQNLKNIKAKKTNVARKIKAQMKICLSGTPMENHYGEFYSLIDLVTPGALGDYKDFMSTYSFKASKESFAVIQKQDIDFLKLKISPLVLRRTKQEILTELPSKTETIQKLPFDQEQEKIYRDIAITYNEKIRQLVATKGEEKSQIEMLTALIRLRQTCSNPAIVNSTTIKYKKIPPKYQALITSVKELIELNESVLVFANFLTTLNNLIPLLEKEKLPFLYINGNINASQRKKILKEFCESNKAYILLMTLKTGGVGLNLTKSSYVFHLEPWWNKAAENQGTDRVHRIGQKKSVQVYNYIMEKSVEEKIQLLKTRKFQAFKALFSHIEESTDEMEQVNFAKNRLSHNDFQYLLS